MMLIDGLTEFYHGSLYIQWLNTVEYRQEDVISEMDP